MYLLTNNGRGKDEDNEIDLLMGVNTKRFLMGLPSATESLEVVYAFSYPDRGYQWCVASSPA